MPFSSISLLLTPSQRHWMGLVSLHWHSLSLILYSPRKPPFWHKPSQKEKVEEEKRKKLSRVGGSGIREQWKARNYDYFGGFPKPKVARTCFGLLFLRCMNPIRGYRIFFAVLCLCWHILIGICHIGNTRQSQHLTREAPHIGFCNHTRRKAIQHSLRRFLIQSGILE